MVAVMVKWWEVIGSDKKCGNRLKLLMKFYEIRGEKKRESSGVRLWSWVTEQLVENISLYWNRKTLWNVGGVKSV